MFPTLSACSLVNSVPGHRVSAQRSKAGSLASCFGLWFGAGIGWWPLVTPSVTSLSCTCEESPQPHEARKQKKTQVSGQGSQHCEEEVFFSFKTARHLSFSSDLTTICQSRNLNTFFFFAYNRNCSEYHGVNEKAVSYFMCFYIRMLFTSRDLQKWNTSIHFESFVQNLDLLILIQLFCKDTIEVLHRQPQNFCHPPSNSRYQVFSCAPWCFRWWWIASSYLSH